MAPALKKVKCMDTLGAKLYSFMFQSQSSEVFFMINGHICCQILIIIRSLRYSVDFAYGVCRKKYFVWELSNQSQTAQCSLCRQVQLQKLCISRYSVSSTESHLVIVNNTYTLRTE